MKQYDKNSLIGLLLMGFILIIFNTYFFPQVEVAETEKKKYYRNCYHYQ